MCFSLYTTTYACSVTTVFEHFIDAHLGFLNQQNSRMQSVSKRLLFLLYSVEQHHMKHQTRPTINQPHIVLFQDEEDDDNLLGQHFNAVEQQLDTWKVQHCCSSFPPSLCTLHFQFCNTTLNKLLTFLQEVMCLSSNKRSPAVVSNIGSISRYENEDD